MTTIGNFYFLKNQYFIDFPDPRIMLNKDVAIDGKNGRPCFYAYYDFKTRIYWLVPISSKVEKYRKIYNENIREYGSCETILFGKVLGYERAFLIQNICPTTIDYIADEYLEPSGKPVGVNKGFEKELIKKVKLVLSLVRKGSLELVWTDIIKIEKMLLYKR